MLPEDFVPLFDNPFRSGIIKEILGQQLIDGSIQGKLLKKGIKHILLREDLTQKWYNDLSEQEQYAIGSFFQNDTVQLFGNARYSFHAIRETEPGEY